MIPAGSIYALPVILVNHYGGINISVPAGRRV
jgi:hypothetical protein